MAKVIAEGLFENRQGRHPIRFESMAAWEGASGTASKWSRAAVNRCRPKQQGLLDTHRVMRLCDGIVEDADLILVMEKRFLELEAFAKNRHKTFLITEFFGESGNITDPDRGRHNISKYIKCFRRLEDLISREKLLIELDRISRWPVRVSAFRSNGTRPARTLNIIDEVVCPICGVTYSLCVNESAARALAARERHLLSQKASAKLTRWLRYSEKHKKSHPRTLSLPDDIID